jgi:hypothetical protein
MFLRRVQAVEASTIVQRELGSQLQISWRVGQPFRIASSEPKDELLKALLLDLRPLVVLGESLNLRAIHAPTHRFASKLACTS